MSKADPQQPTHPAGVPMKAPNEPLYGFVPRMVTSKQVQRAQVR